MVVPTLVLPIREYLLAGLTAAVVTFLLVGPVRTLALRFGAVAWPQTLVMMAGCIIGGTCGAQFARVVPQSVMRVVVVAVGALLTVVFAWRYWF